MTDFIYRKKNALSPNFCRSLIELFEIDKERQSRGVIRKQGEVQLADDQKISTDISFIPPDLQDERWGKSLQEIINTVCLLYTSPSPRDVEESRMPSSA